MPCLKKWKRGSNLLDRGSNSLFRCPSHSLFDLLSIFLCVLVQLLHSFSTCISHHQSSSSPYSPHHSQLPQGLFPTQVPNARRTRPTEHIVPSSTPGHTSQDTQAVSPPHSLLRTTKLSKDPKRILKKSITNRQQKQHRLHIEPESSACPNP